VVLPTALATWYENWRARKRRFEPVNGGFALVALSVNTDMSRTVPQHFGRMPDVLISSVELCGGRKFLTIEDMNTVAKSVARACAGYRHTVIKLVLSGPPALAAQLTRYLPVDKYRIIFCYWDGQGYIELPPVDIQEYAEVSG
jgi:ABC-type proline/glycine betaine transport system substrate-binding protein